MASNSLHARRRTQNDFSHDAKRRKIDARTVNTQPIDAALVDGELDVGKFIKTREFEIAALDEALKSAKTALSSQAFQELPISMRRRTGSHNVKRLPKRLRTRALGEVLFRSIMKWLF
jgi:ribonuclease P/MRP protein subunit POP1